MKKTPKELALEVISILNKRNQNIIKKRFGLIDGTNRTLESIGRDYGVTRERIRQIVEASLENLKKSSQISLLRDFWRTAAKVLQKTNGVETEKGFLEKLVSILGVSPGQIAAIKFLLCLSPEIKLEPETKQHKSFWRRKSLSPAHIANIVSKIEEYFQKQKRVFRPEEMMKWAKQNISPKITLAELEVYLLLSPKIGRNIFGEYGLLQWPEITPRGAKDRAYMMLKHYRKPLHFSKIAERINELRDTKAVVPTHHSWLKKIQVQTVHNELIKDPRFVLIGRGIYALRDWGYQPGTVADVIKDVLKHAGRPLTAKAIIRQVKKKRLARDTTIILNLNNKKLFKKLPGHRYTLAHSASKPKVLEI